MHFMRHLALYLPTLFLLTLIAFSQTDNQLRDPEFLVDQYNQLVIKHNALIDKTRKFISEKQSVQGRNYPTENELNLKLKDEMAKNAVLETRLSKIKQEEVRANTNKQYFDDSNARLRRQLQELKADEQELAARNKELSLINKKLINDKKSFDEEEKNNYSKI